jgi:acylphosphatase
MKTQLSAIVKGNVQGVGFRATTKLIADKLKLTGFVRNLSSGDVEICAQGEREALEQLLTELKQAFPPHYIDQILFDFKPITVPYPDFKINRD